MTIQGAGFYGGAAPAGVGMYTEEFMQALDEAGAKREAEDAAAYERWRQGPAEEVCPAGECDGTGAIWGDECTCGTGPSGYHGAHEPGCGSEPCPAGCWQAGRE